MTNEMEEDSSYLQMEISSKENIKLEKLMAKVRILGGTQRCMTENGRMVKRRAMACGEVFMEIAIQASGSITKLKDMEFILGLMVIDMRENGKHVLEMVMEQIFSRTLMSMQVNIAKVNHLVTDNTNGQMETLTVANSTTV